MGWVIALLSCGLSGVVAYSMGIRAERGRHARWSEIQRIASEKRRGIGGVTLKRIRISR